jgi:hypothetical protein
VSIAVTSLLPPNAAAFDRANSGVTAARLPAQFDRVAAICTLWDPWTCPAAQLPLLAWAWSVDIWNEAWTLDRKRQVVAEARIYHQRKTTVAGYRMALGYVDAQLVRARLPRDAYFAGAAPTEASHAAWLAALPEIRIYLADYAIKRTRAGQFVGRLFAGSAARIVLGRRRAELRRDGTIQPLVFAGVRLDASGRLLTDPERLVIPGPRRATLQVGKSIRARRVPDGRLASERMVLLSFTAGGDAYIPNAAATGLSPIDVTPRRLWEPLPGGQGLFANGAWRRRGVRPNRADEQAYLSLRLADGSSAQLGRMRNRLGRTRLRRPAFTASILVHAPGPKVRAFPPTGRYLRAGPEVRVAELARTLGVTQAARDTLFLDINAIRPLVYGDLAKLDDTATYGLTVSR